VKNQKEISTFFKKYFKKEKELGAINESPQQFRTLGNSFEICIGQFILGYDRRISISDDIDGSIFYDARPSDLVKLTRKAYPADSIAKVVLCETEVREYKQKLNEWQRCYPSERNRGPELTIDFFNPVKVGEAEFCEQVTKIKSEAEQSQELFHAFCDFDFKYPKECAIKVDNEYFICIKRLSDLEGKIVLVVPSVHFKGENDEILKFAESVDEVIEECRSRAQQKEKSVNPEHP
jgi:hypothetical protein